jgi:hypothetical protein
VSVRLTPGMARDVAAMEHAEERFLALDEPTALERWRQLGAPCGASLLEAQRAVVQAGDSERVWETAAWELAQRIERVEQSRLAVRSEGRS